MKVFLAGATGAIGRRLLPMLVRDGHEVTGMTRSPGRAEWIRSQGAEAVVCDVFDRAGVAKAMTQAEPEVLIHQLTSIPQRINPRRITEDLAPTNRLRTEGTYILAEAARAVGVQRFIAQSVAFFYDPDGNSPANEDEGLYRGIPDTDEIVDAIHVHEHGVMGSPGIEGVVLRYGFLYGPCTSYAAGGAFAKDVRRRRVPLVGKAQGIFSYTHVFDAAEAAALAVERGEPGIYNIVDDEPVPVSEWLPCYAKVLGAPRPFRVPRAIARLGAGRYGVYLMTRQRGASNEKAKQSLDWKPSRPSWRQGFAAELAS